MVPRNFLLILIPLERHELRRSHSLKNRFWLVLLILNWAELEVSPSLVFSRHWPFELLIFPYDLYLLEIGIVETTTVCLNRFDWQSLVFSFWKKFGIFFTSLTNFRAVNCETYRGIGVYSLSVEATRGDCIDLISYLLLLISQLSIWEQISAQTNIWDRNRGLFRTRKNIMRHNVHIRLSHCSGQFLLGGHFV